MLLRARSLCRNAGRRLAGRLRAYAVATGGQAAVFFGLAAVPLLGVSGLALDSGRAYLVEAKLSRALDAAGLAAARVGRSANAQADAESFFHANYPEGYLSSEITSFTFIVRPGGDVFDISATADVPTTLMRILGQTQLTIARRTEVQRLSSGLELALVMDNTGSMEGTKIAQMKSAARTLVDILFGDATELDNVWISLVPYTSTVNIGPADKSLGTWLRDPARVAPGTGVYGVSAWKGCVDARTAPMPGSGVSGDESDEPPRAGAPATQFQSFLYPRAIDNRYDKTDASSIDERNSKGNDATGPNIGCGPAITPLTNQRDVAMAAIDEMLAWARGGTTSNLGVVWGWRTISPRWRGLWPGLGGAWPGPHGAMDMPLDHGEPLMSKAVVLLTDGNNQFYDWPGFYPLPEYVGPPTGNGPSGSDHTAYGRLKDWQPGYTALQGQRALDAKLKRVCTAMRAEGIEVFTITFGDGLNAETQAVYKSCAGDPGRYYHAPSGAELAIAFRSIGQQLSNLRIVR